jgi:2'-5' RNA ligase
MPRLFAGLELPEDVRGELARLKCPIPGARWVEPANLHLTMRFAGDLDTLRAAEFAGALSEINASAFSLRVSGTGAFGGNAPAVLWAGFEKNADLDALQRATERAARRAGLPPETRAFKPHITLARLNHARDETLARFLERHARFTAGPMFVSRFVLFSSRPKVGGGPYVVEEAFNLLGGLGDSEGLEDVW